MSQPISLIGMPGGGKSTVGKQLARKLRADFIDTDALIEGRIGEPIRGFFDRHGEPAFRDIETEILSSLVATIAPNSVIATGGGVVLRPANRELLRGHAAVVYLHSLPEELFRRLRHDAIRPLLQVKDPLTKLRELYHLRHPLYQQTAHFVVETGRPSVATLASMIVMQMELAGLVKGEEAPAHPTSSAPRGAPDSYTKRHG